MSRRLAALKPQLNRIRAWAYEGSTDAWIAHQLETTAEAVRAFRQEHGIERGGPAPLAPITPDSVVEAMLAEEAAALEAGPEPIEPESSSAGRRATRRERGAPARTPRRAHPAARGRRRRRRPRGRGAADAAAVEERRGRQLKRPPSPAAAAARAAARAGAPPPGRSGRADRRSRARGGPRPRRESGGSRSTRNPAAAGASADGAAVAAAGTRGSRRASSRAASCCSTPRDRRPDLPGALGRTRDRCASR